MVWPWYLVYEMAKPGQAVNEIKSLIYFTNIIIFTNNWLTILGKSDIQQMAGE